MVFKTNQFEEFTVRKANIKDSDRIIRLLKAAATWIRAKGINQWGYLLEGGEDEEIKANIVAGNTYIIENDNQEIVATFNFTNRQNEWDIDMWGKQHDDLVYYIHRLAVAEKFHHMRIGSRLVRWIDENFALQNGTIRLDCVGNNAVLNRFYQDHGFTLQGSVGEGEDKFSLYEKVFQR